MSEDIMIIGSSAVLTASGPDGTVEHLRHGAENDRVELIRRTWQDIDDMFDDAERFGRRYAIQHFIIAPYEPMTREFMLTNVLPLLAAEFRFEPFECSIVEHEKPRAGDDNAFPIHWHIVVGHYDPDTGRVGQRWWQSYQRQELIARIVEYRQWAAAENPDPAGPRFVLGRFHDTNVKILRAHEDPEMQAIGAALERAFPLGSEPEGTAPAANVVRMNKREGRDIVALRKVCREAWRETRTAEEFRQAIEAHGLYVKLAENPPARWMVTDGVDGVWTLAGMVHAKIDDVVTRMGDPADADREPRDEEAEPGGPGEPAPVWDDVEYARIVDAAHADGGDRAAAAVSDAGERGACADLVAALQHHGEAVAAIVEEAEAQAAVPIVRLNNLISEKEVAARRVIARAESFEHPEGHVLKASRRDLKKHQSKETRVTDRLSKRTAALQTLQKEPVPSIFRPIKRWRHKRAVAAAQALVNRSSTALEKVQEARRDAKKRVDYWVKIHTSAAANARKPLDQAALEAQRELRVCERARELVKNDPLVLRYSASGVYAMAQKDIDRQDRHDVERWEPMSPEDDHDPGFSLRL